MQPNKVQETQKYKIAIINFTRKISQKYIVKRFFFHEKNAGRIRVKFEKKSEPGPHFCILLTNMEKTAFKRADRSSKTFSWYE
jgi:hypothetical protein